MEKYAKKSGALDIEFVFSGVDGARLRAKNKSENRSSRLFLIRLHRH
jgi:hypothetical protein